MYNIQMVKYTGNFGAYLSTNRAIGGVEYGVHISSNIHAKFI